jgi:hypothetical protein
MERGAGALAALACGLLLGGCQAGPAPPIAPPQPPPALSAAETEALLDDLEERTFRFFWDLAHPTTGLVPDRWPTQSFSSVAAVGFGLTAYPIGAERGWVTRAQARERTLATLRFLAAAPQGEQARGVAGHRGFFYHFLVMETGHRFETVELSTVDTALLLAGVLFVQSYFDGDHPAEAEIRAVAERLYARAEWTWAQARPPALSHGWRPESGFIRWDWIGYSEAMIVYLLALGSPSHPVGAEAWHGPGGWTSGYQWTTLHGQAHVPFGPLFGHQYTHVWIDFRGLQDEAMRRHGIDYFENSRRAVYAQRAYAVANPLGYAGHGAELWGLTACDGPADATLAAGGRRVTFHTYWARGLYHDQGPLDDGTLAPTAAAASLPFAPEIALPAIVAMTRRFGEHLYGRYGFLDAFNLTFPGGVPLQHGKMVDGVGWFDTDYLGIDQGPILAMVENHRSGLVWETMKRNPHVVRGLCRAGFSGGWLRCPG